MPQELQRIFIAINLPSQTKQDLIHYLTKIKKINSSRNFKYPKPQGLHLTLHFLGYLSPDQIDQIKQIISQVTKNKDKFSLTLKSLAAFPNLNYPRIIYLDCSGGTGQTLQIREELAFELEKVGLEIDSRKWQTHITICRINDNEKFIVPNFDVPKLQFQIESIDLMKSKLTPQGPEYSIIEKYKLL